MPEIAENIKVSFLSSMIASLSTDLIKRLLLDLKTQRLRSCLMSRLSRLLIVFLHSFFGLFSVIYQCFGWLNWF